MTREQLIEMLRGHKMAKARLEILRVEAGEMLMQINRAAREDAAQSAMHSSLGGMPGSGIISKPVEAAGIRSLDGVLSPQMRQWLEESEQMQQELQQLERRVETIDRALGGLRQQERVTVEQHIMEGISWRELASMSPRLYGEHKSQGTLRGWQSDALDKMLIALEGTKL